VSNELKSRRFAHSAASSLSAINYNGAISSAVGGGRYTVDGRRSVVSRLVVCLYGLSYTCLTGKMGSSFAFKSLISIL